jgi:RNA 3'-terminal phosphate cyclase (ATP)
MSNTGLIHIDGSEGEGGGQVLRSSLALSVCLSKPFVIENIRAKRKKPGLLRQHLTAVRAATRISNAKVEGDSLGSQRLVFEPNEVQAGEYHFSIGTAGSTTLVLQTVMLPLLFARESSKVVVEGGTHNPLAPPFEFIQQAFLPLLEKMGAEIEATLVRPGFFPQGGGRIELEIQPIKKLKPVSLLERGEMRSLHGVVYVLGLPLHIAEREISVLARKLKVSESDFKVMSYDREYGPGNIIFVSIDCDNVCEVFTAYGQKGVKAEIVAKGVVKEVRRYIDSGVPVDEHLADQLLLPLALAGSGKFISNTLSQHTVTNVETIKKFVDINIDVESVDKNYLIKIGN